MKSILLALFIAFFFAVSCGQDSAGPASSLTYGSGSSSSPDSINVYPPAESKPEPNSSESSTESEIPKVDEVPYLILPLNDQPEIKFTLIEMPTLKYVPVGSSFNLLDILNSIPPPTKKTITMENSGAPWLIAFEMMGRLFRFATLKAGTEPVITTDTNADVSWGGDKVKCLIFIKVDAQMTAKAGSMQFAFERCQNTMTEATDIYSPDSISLVMDNFKYDDPCLGEVVVSGNSSCKGTLAHYKKIEQPTWLGTYSCSGTAIYNVGGKTYNVVMPTYYGGTDKDINGGDLEDLSSYFLNGNISINGTVTTLEDYSIPEDVKECLK